MIQFIDNENPNKVHFVTANSEILFLVQSVRMLTNSDSVMSGGGVDDGKFFIFSVLDRTLYGEWFKFHNHVPVNN